MQLRVLGCAGGIGGRERLTTCLALDRDILIDAGTGVSSLAVEDLLAIDHVFLTHGHLDHVCGVAFLLDAVLGRRELPVTVHASPNLTAVLKEHLFNWAIWPDFAKLPSAQQPLLQWSPFAPGERVVLGGRAITALPVEHTVPAVAYHVVGDAAGFVFSGDMAATPTFWSGIAAASTVGAVFVDCSFPNAEAAVALRSKHYCPGTLVADIAPLPSAVPVYVTHLKPGAEDLILGELREAAADRTFHGLRQGDTFSF